MVFQTTTGPCLLIVDEGYSVREEFHCILQNQCRIIEASGVGEAFRFIDREPPDLVTPDIHMPGKNGLEGLRLIRERSEDLPVAMITGVGSTDRACEALRSSASNSLKRPCGYDRLRPPDNGIGIPVARSVDSRMTDFNRTNRQACGLGLFVADWMLHNHGAKLQLFSQEGVGTTAEPILPATC
jgi:CheY-like chemotaxis protein